MAVGRSAPDRAREVRSPILPRHERRVTVRPVESGAELEAVAELCERGYAQAALPRVVRRAWWEAFPLGLWVAVRDDGRILGQIGIWPLPEAVAGLFARGLTAERDLPPTAFAAYRSAPASCWYVSGLAVAPEYRRTRLTHALLADALRGWMRQCPQRFPLRCWALGQTLEGLRLLERCGFRLTQDKAVMPDGFPLYSLELRTWPDLRGLLARRGLLAGDGCLPDRVWVPGAPQLAEYHGAPADYADLVHAWCAEEGLPERSVVRMRLHATASSITSLDRLTRLIENAAGVVVERSELVRDGRDGLEIVWLRDASDGAEIPTAHEQIALFDADAEVREP